MDNQTKTINPGKHSSMGNIINLMTLAYLDGNVSEDEKNIINDIAHSYGLSKEEFDFCAAKAEECLKDGKAVIEVPEDDDSKLVFIRNLVLGMMCDGHIAKEEEQYVQFIAEKFGFKGEEIVEYMIQSVAEEFSGQNEVNDSEPKDDDEALKQEIAHSIALGKEALMKHDIQAAFDYLIKPAHLDRDACSLFRRIPENEKWIRLLSDEQVDQLKEYAEKGYALSQYTLGRYYQVESASYDEARDLFLAASKAGIIDASAALAIMYRYGQLGETELDYDKYYAALQDAQEKGSTLACHQLFKAGIFGKDQLEAKPQEAIDCIKEFLNGNESEDLLEVNPIYYELLGFAYQELNDWKSASDYYKKCIRMGYIEVYSDFAIITTHNQNYEVIDEEGYAQAIENGCGLRDPYCFLLRAGENSIRYNDTEDENEKAALAKSIAEDLTTASNLGDGTATYEMGYYYYYGEYGFEENEQLAWQHFILASGMNSADAWDMLVQMYLDGNAPDQLPNDFVNYCRLMGLRMGDSDMLIPVVMAYRKGLYGKYKNEIEKYYLPRYDALSDEKKVTYFGMNFVALVKPTGKTDIIEFDLERENWDELVEIIDAKELAPIRTGKLNQIGKDAGFEEAVTAWVDKDAATKRLEPNPIGNKIYPGPVLGHMILTLEDENGQPKCFDDIYQLEQIIADLGSEVERIYYDETPDDDGRWDPHA